MVIHQSIVHFIIMQEPPRLFPEGDSLELCWLEKHVERIGTETGTGFFAHVNTWFLLRELFPDPKEVVSAQECASI